MSQSHPHITLPDSQCPLTSKTHPKQGSRARVYRMVYEMGSGSSDITFLGVLLGHPSSSAGWGSENGAGVSGVPRGWPCLCCAHHVPLLPMTAARPWAPPHFRWSTGSLHRTPPIRNWVRSPPTHTHVPHYTLSPDCDSQLQKSLLRGS